VQLSQLRIGNEAVILPPSIHAGEGCGGICVVGSRPAVGSTGQHPPNDGGNEVLLLSILFVGGNPMSLDRQ